MTPKCKEKKHKDVTMTQRIKTHKGKLTQRTVSKLTYNLVISCKLVMKSTNKTKNNKLKLEDQNFELKNYR